jgi:P-type Cu+ transporter
MGEQIIDELMGALKFDSSLIDGRGVPGAGLLAAPAGGDCCAPSLRPATPAAEPARPEQKATAVARMQGKGQVVAMAGDGINDAPALARADVAMAAADLALLGGDLRLIPRAIALSRATMRTIRQNLFWAFFYNVILIPLATFGMVNPTFATAAMALSSVTVIGTSLRLGRFGRSSGAIGGA